MDGNAKVNTGCGGCAKASEELRTLKLLRMFDRHARERFEIETKAMMRIEREALETAREEIKTLRAELALLKHAKEQSDFRLEAIDRDNARLVAADEVITNRLNRALAALAEVGMRSVERGNRG